MELIDRREQPAPEGDFFSRIAVGILLSLIPVKKNDDKEDSGE